jgi:hypothetical protein
MDRIIADALVFVFLAPSNKTIRYKQQPVTTSASPVGQHCIMVLPSGYQYLGDILLFVFLPTYIISSIWFIMRRKYFPISGRYACNYTARRDSFIPLWRVSPTMHVD